jgi:glycosyltransferase involved in cell wall biosynthesis
MKPISFLHVLGRGIEGCGVSRYALELDKWLNNQGHESTIIALQDQWTLGKILVKNEASPIITISPDDLSNLDLSEIQVLIIHSFPPSRGPKGSTGATREIDYTSGFAMQALITRANEQGVRTCAIVLDHHPMSWGRNMFFWEQLNQLDLVFAHSDHGRFKRYLEKNGVNQPRLTQLALAMEMPEPSEWLPMHVQKRSFSYVGRYATFKDPGRVFPIRAKITPDKQVVMTMAGVARVIESAWIRKDPAYIEGEASLRHKLVELEDTAQAHSGIIVYREHPRAWGLDYLRHTAIACDFYHMGADDYGSDTEYAILEAVAAGSVIALDPHYVDHCRQFADPRKMWSASTWLTVSKDPQAFEIENILALLDDPDLRNQLRLQQREFMIINHSPDVCFNRLLGDLEL